MINTNKYFKVTGQVISINHFIGDAVIRLQDGNTITVDVGRLNKRAVHVGDTVKAEINYRIMGERFYGPVIKNLSAGL
jgi:hypothetical protein